MHETLSFYRERLANFTNAAMMRALNSHGMAMTFSTDRPPESAEAASGSAIPRTFAIGLSGKLMVLMLLSFLVAEVLVYVPAIATFRRNWLFDRLGAARTAALVLEAAPNNSIPDELVSELLTSVGAEAIALKTGPARRLLSRETMPREVDISVDLRKLSLWPAIAEAFDTLLAHDGRLLRVAGEARNNADYVEVVLVETPMRQAMLAFSRDILLALLLLFGMTAALGYLSLHLLFVRPMRRMIQAMAHFRERPDDAARIIVPGRRNDEIGVAEHDLRDLQASVHSTLAQKHRLAALGLAVSKINHDLRNMLSSAQLFSDRLSHSDDPTVQRLVPKIMRTLDRAISYCQSSLDYGRVQEAKPQRARVAVAPVIDEVHSLLGLAIDDRFTFVNAVSPELMVDADPDQLLRVLLNLGRNAVQALESLPKTGVRGEIRFSGFREGSVVTLEVADNGPGVPAKAREHLFEAFQGSTRIGGAGLGLAIAAEIVRAHGGTITLAEGVVGALFRLTLTDQPVDLSRARRRLRSA